MPIEAQFEKAKLCCSWLEEVMDKVIKNNQNPHDNRSLNDSPLDHDKYAVVINDYSGAPHEKADKKEDPFYLQIGSFNYVFNAITQIPGLSHYPKYSRFYISVAPHIGYQHLIEQEAKNILASTPDLTEEIFFEERSKIEYRYAKRYLSDSLTAITKLHQLKQQDEIHIIVIGEENLIAYQDKIQLGNKLPNSVSSSLSLQSYTFSLAENSELAGDKIIEQPIVLHVIAGKGNMLALQSTDFEQLYSILVSQKPLLIHCSQGLDRAGKLLFALLLGEKFKKIFLSAKSSQAMYENIEKQWIKLKKEHSPQALGNIIDFKQAVYLGFILGLIHLQNKLKQPKAKTKFFRAREKRSSSLLNEIDRIRKEIEAKLLVLLEPPEGLAPQIVSQDIVEYSNLKISGLGNN